MRIQRDLTMAGFALRYLEGLKKDAKKLSCEVEQYKQEMLRNSRQNYKIRRK